MELIKATAADVQAAAEIYESVKNGEFSVWNENYPTADDATRDEAAGCLYILKDGEETIGCASVEPEAEDDDLPFWRVNDGTHREISRIAINPAHQGKGYAAKFLAKRIRIEMTIESTSSNCHAIRNPPPFPNRFSFEIIYPHIPSLRQSVFPAAIWQ